MEYTIKKLANLAKITTRTIRYYDEINLLKPARINSSGYRIYGEKEVKKLQQIMFFRELDFELGKIENIINSKHYFVLQELKNHKIQLLEKRELLDKLLNNLDQTIKIEEGEKISMKNEEKFLGFKQNLINENEKKYGKEISEKYDKEIIKKSNENFMNLSQEKFEEMNRINTELLDALKEYEINKNESLSKKIFDLHKKWLMFTWTDYSFEAHIGLSHMYVTDERFKKYYDVAGENAAENLRNIIKKHAK